MSPGDALDVARASEPATPQQTDPRDPPGLRPGQRVSVVADLDSGEAPVLGTVRLVDRDRIALLREDQRVGTVCVHFPRAGYRVAAA
jgi:glutathione S-transferase